MLEGPLTGDVVHKEDSLWETMQMVGGHKTDANLRHGSTLFRPIKKCFTYSCMFTKKRIDGIARKPESQTRYGQVGLPALVCSTAL